VEDDDFGINISSWSVKSFIFEQKCMIHLRHLGTENACGTETGSVVIWSSLCHSANVRLVAKSGDASPLIFSVLFGDAV
jgi:hypothetical protein